MIVLYRLTVAVAVAAALGRSLSLTPGVRDAWHAWHVCACVCTSDYDCDDVCTFVCTCVCTCVCICVCICTYLTVPLTLTIPLCPPLHGLLLLLLLLKLILNTTLQQGVATNIGLYLIKMSSTSNATLQGCVTSLRSSMQLLDSSINILDSGVCDYPRLAKVLQSTKVSRCWS